MKIMKYLPKKPSRLIRIALKDLAAREIDPRYVVCMATWHSPAWHSPALDSKCLVCLAGATMARLGASPGTRYHYKSFGSKNEQRFVALNYFRVGRIYSALEALGIDLPKGIKAHQEVPEYDADPVGFKRALALIANRLESLGL